MTESARKTILLVEDEIILSRAESIIVEGFGYEVVAAHDGETAIDMVSGDRKIDLILMDIDLGGAVDGPEAARRILEKRNVPIVFLTSHTESDYVDRVKEITRYGYVIKNSGDFVLRSSIDMAFELFEAKMQEKKKNDELKESEESLAITLQSIGDGVIATDNGGLVTRMNAMAETMTGWSFGEARGRPLNEIFKIINAKTRIGVDNPVEKVLETGAIMGLANHTILLGRGGKEYQIADSAAPIRDKDGIVRGVILVFADVTGKYKVSEDLQASEAQKNAILNGITTNLAFVDSELKIIWANNTAARSVNKSPEEMKGQPCYKFWADPAKPCANCPTLKAFQTKKTEQTIMRTPDGRVWEEKGEPVFDSDGNLIGVVEIAADITERVHTEEALRQSEQRLQFVLQGSRLGFWDWNLETNEVKRNERWAEMLGYRLDDIEFSVKQWIDFIHPDDREMAMKSINDHLEGRTPVHRIEYRMRTKDGRYKWILDQAMAVSVDKNGKVNRMSGTHTDITASKLAEEKIKALLAEKELMLKEVHHRVKNNMNTVASLLALQEELVKDEAAAAALKDSRNRVTSMKVLYDKLYRSDDFKETSFREYISPLIEEIVNNFPNRAIVRIEKNIDDFMIDAKKLSSLGIIINELLTNIMKYAFTGRKSGLIKISASHVNGLARVSVRDDGIGMPEPADFSRAEGFGLQLVEMLTRQLGGSIKRENENETGTGTGFVLEFSLY